MKEKFTVIRSEAKLKDLSPEIQALFDKKHVKIIKTQEEAEQTENDLLISIGKLAVENAEDIMKITEQKGFTLPEEEKNKEENLQTLTKSLEAISGVPLKAVKKGRRRVKVQ